MLLVAVDGVVAAFLSCADGCVLYLFLLRVHVWSHSGSLSDLSLHICINVEFMEISTTSIHPAIYLSSYLFFYLFVCCFLPLSIFGMQYVYDLGIHRQENVSLNFLFRISSLFFLSFMKYAGGVVWCTARAHMVHT